MLLLIFAILVVDYLFFEMIPAMITLFKRLTVAVIVYLIYNLGSILGGLVPLLIIFSISYLYVSRKMKRTTVYQIDFIDDHTVRVNGKIHRV